MEADSDATEDQERAHHGSDSGKQFMPSTSTRSRILVPREHDVLCSQSRTLNEHAGNRLLREIIAKYVPEYAQAKTKIEKTSLHRHVVNVISSQGGKFLKLDEENDEWFEVDYASARNEVGQAFRTAMSPKQESDKGPQIERGRENSESIESASSLLLQQRAAVTAALRMYETASQHRERDQNSHATGQRSQASSVSDSLKESRMLPAGSLQVSKSGAVSRRTSKTTARLERASDDFEMVNSKIAKSSKEPSRRRSSSSALATSLPTNASTEPPKVMSLSAMRETDQVSTSRHAPGVNISASYPTQEDRKDFLDLAKHKRVSSAQNSVASNPHFFHHHGVSQGQELPITDKQPIQQGIPTRFHQPSATRPIQASKPINPGDFALPGLKRQLPNMLDTRELKRAMYQTLALRQQALEQNTTTQSALAGSAPAIVGRLIGNAMSNHQSPQEILQQALAVQKKAFLQAAEMGSSSSSSNSSSKGGRMTDAVLKIVERNTGQDKRNDKEKGSALRRPDTEKGTGLLKKTGETAKGPSADEIPLVSPDSLAKPPLSASALLNLQRLKRRRSLASVDPAESPKKRMSLAEVATEHAIQSQKSYGLWFASPLHDDEDRTSQFYFL